MSMTFPRKELICNHTFRGRFMEERCDDFFFFFFFMLSVVLLDQKIKIVTDLYIFLCLNKLKKQTLCFHDWMNKLTFKENTVSSCFNSAYMWRTLPPFLASDRVLGTLFSPENRFFIQHWKKQIFPSLHHWVRLLHSWRTTGASEKIEGRQNEDNLYRWMKNIFLWEWEIHLALIFVGPGVFDGILRDVWPDWAMQSTTLLKTASPIVLYDTTSTFSSINLITSEVDSVRESFSWVWFITLYV